MSSTLRVKLRRDLRASWSRFALMVLAIAVSLSVSGGVLMAWAATDREIGGAYQSTAPASATIVLADAVDTEPMAAIVDAVRGRPQVIEAIGRAQFDAQVEVDGVPRAQPLQTFVAAPDDPMRMVRFDLRQEGSWPPASDEILLGNDDTLPLLGAKIGDTLTVTPPGGEPVQVRVAGTVYDPSLAPSMQEQRGHGYLSTAAMERSGTRFRLDQVKIQVADRGQSVPTRDRHTAVRVATEVATWLEREYGATVAEIQVPKPYDHPHQWQFEVLLASLLVGGAAALLLSAILVATMLDNLFVRQIPQIGIMKAVGARSARIGGMYLTMTLLVAMAATLLSVWPATWIAGGRVDSLARIIGVEPSNVAAPAWTYVVLVAVGLGLPVVLALFPLVKAARTTVRAAIDHHGGATKPGSAAGFLARLSNLRQVDRGLLLALRNTVRRPARFWLSVGLLASAGIVFVAGVSLRSSTDALEEQRKAQRYWDVEVQLTGLAGGLAVADAVRNVPGVERVETWRREQLGVAAAGRYAVTRTYPDQGHGSVAVNTIPNEPLHPRPPVSDGRWLEAGETKAVVLNERMRDGNSPGVEAGDTVRLFVDGEPSTWRVVGVVEEGDASGRGAYVTAEGLAAAMGQPAEVNRVRVVTDSHDERTRATVAAALDRALTRAGIEVELVSSVSRTNAASAGHAGPVLLVLIGVALPLAVLGGIGLASTMSANVLDRTRELGVMHAIGARPRQVRRIVVAEGVILALTSCLVAVLPTLGLTKLLGVGLGNLFGDSDLPFRISALAVGIWLLVVVLGAILATEAAATRASRVTVREALSYL